MITCFPIVQTPSERKKKFCSVRRDLLCSSKLEFICNRLKQANQKQIKTLNSNEDSTINYSNQEQTIIKETQFVSSFVHRYQSLQQVGRKKCSHKRNEGLHKSFNRTRTDWDHNFVGNKYIQKIKQELRSTKHTSFTQKQQIKCNNFHEIENPQQPFTLDPAHNFRKTQYRRGLSQEQLQRIKILKQKRRNKVYESLKQLQGSKKAHISNLQRKQSSCLEKSQPISPWDDCAPSQFSSMYMKKF